MSQKEIIIAFSKLGNFLKQFTPQGNLANNQTAYNDLFFDPFIDLIQISKAHNGWFTPEQVYFSIQSWADALTEENLIQWLAPYSYNEKNPKTIALILAGNIPLVGFHDFISVLLSGNKVLAKLSSNDQKLLPFLANYLKAVEPKLKNRILFTEEKLENFDAVIATGSNNTARYFEYYFRNKPSIIRKNRNSVAILDGNENKENLFLLGEDIFRYFGLGCRNVSKIFIPKDYDFKLFFEAIYPYGEIIHYEKYANNYDYNKAVFLMSLFKILDNEFLTLKEDTSYASPISSLFYEYYEDLEEIKNRLINDQDLIQCIVSNQLVENSIPFGQTQKPKLWDYADNIDTIAFLNSL
ncbi:MULTISPECIES: acyl-CoA reductase [Flavobacterium]|uniref:Acyl-CoA reductase n=2 Tax=Flavobacterium TaxID=237 RepID=A0AA94F1S6_9FLAO|nr:MULTISPECIES: acyl-CoA reductase [Flavobacterium]OXA74634.1 acyl-CoA reductase [Flavobacterium columnare] [Flavobacterium columnare NBRC 100251 = ATCC 23463]AMA49059.1 acyl-CoA reductase [Flavobacterium covae]AND64867.1 acyl-CoA reductase [Flavobacterium covae]MCH4830991.1 acyl-CoA reductase [Flavobacterium columnare]MCH4833068.1 acyl-CoA reductase [Flavobacterium columnare]